ncbi:uncharacterized protein [Littorina saxatilis]|uniref:Uncharacterized protein n=1 Tax=Littorina saxatilis TaxID=31220 RepID=A0AAN9G0L5_9CAEN
MYIYKPALLFLLGHIAAALRTCVDVQNTLIACVVSSDVDPMVMSGQEDVDKLCWHVSVMLECVSEARDTCPNLPILADESFARAIRDMEQQRAGHCQSEETTPVPSTITTSTSMSNDQPRPCDPVAAMIRCNDFMTGVTPGDVKAMCTPGEAYLTCLTNIVHTCPEHSDLLPFDLQDAIGSTRSILKHECPATLAEKECQGKIEDAKRSCADYLSDGNGDYCRSLEVYVGCLHNTLSSCPDQELQESISNQYRHHCEKPIGSQKCPDDVQAAIMECSANIMGGPPGDPDAYCRLSEEYFNCLEDLMDACENDTRFSAFPMPPNIDQLRQQAHLMCNPSPAENIITAGP